MLSEGMPEVIADRMIDLERYFRENHASRITSDIKNVTGRNPERFFSICKRLRNGTAAGLIEPNMFSL